MVIREGEFGSLFAHIISMTYSREYTEIYVSRKSFQFPIPGGQARTVVAYLENTYRPLRTLCYVSDTNCRCVVHLNIVIRGFLKTEIKVRLSLRPQLLSSLGVG